METRPRRWPSHGCGDTDLWCRFLARSGRVKRRRTPAPRGGHWTARSFVASPVSFGESVWTRFEAHTFFFRIRIAAAAIATMATTTITPPAMRSVLSPGGAGTLGIAEPSLDFGLSPNPFVAVIW